MSDFKKKRFFITVFSAIVVGLFAHLFGMINSITAIDSIITVEGTGAGITSGRWGLEILNNYVTKLWPMWNMPFFNNGLAIFFLALSAWVVVLIFDIKDLYLCALFGGIFLCFPSVCSTFYYSLATVHYALAVLMSVYSVYITDKYKWGFIPASLLSATAIGIYQAYYPMTAALYVSLLIVKALSSDSKASALLKRAFFYLGTMLLALLEYFIILKIMLAATGQELSGYQGIDSMGQFALHEIPALIAGPYLSFFKMFLMPESEAVNTSAAQHGLLLLGLISAGIIIYTCIKDRKRIFKQDKGILFLFLILYPAALFGIRIMCFHSEIHSLMIYAAVLIYIVPIVLLKHFEALPGGVKKEKARKLLRIAVIILLSINILNYCLQSNLSYNRDYVQRQQMSSFADGLIARAQATPGYNDKLKWILCGPPDDDIFIDRWEDVPFSDFGGGSYSRGYLINYIYDVLGYTFPYVSDEIHNSIWFSPEVQAMPLYPDDGSIKIFDDIIVIKLTN